MLAHSPTHSFELRIDKSRTSFRQATATRKMPAADRLSDALDRLNLLGCCQPVAEQSALQCPSHLNAERDTNCCRQKDQAASDMHCYGQQLSLLGIKGMKKAAAGAHQDGLQC